MITKDNKKEIIKIICFAVVLIFAFIHIKEIWNFLGFLIKLLMPFIIGIVIAFVLNILINLIEKKLLNKSKMSNKSKRTIIFFGRVVADSSLSTIPSSSNNSHDPSYSSA